MPRRILATGRSPNACDGKPRVPALHTTPTWDSIAKNAAVFFIRLLLRDSCNPPLPLGCMGTHHAPSMADDVANRIPRTPGNTAHGAACLLPTHAQATESVRHSLGLSHIARQSGQSCHSDQERLLRMGDARSIPIVLRAGRGEHDVGTKTMTSE